MKTKALLLLGLCAIGISTWEAQAVNTKPIPVIKSEITDPPQGYEKIDLKGTLMYGIGPNAIIGGASDDAVYIGFNQNFGNVNICIYNSTGGLVYSTIVNSSIQTEIFIPFANVSIGTYIVELNNANGYAEGDFERD